MITSILAALLVAVLNCNAALPKPDRTLGFVARGKARTIKVLKTAQIVNVNVYGLRTFPLDEEEVDLSKVSDDLWPARDRQERLRGDDLFIEFPRSNKQYVNNLPPIAQAKLWNNDTQYKGSKYEEFKRDCKEFCLAKYST